MDRGRRPARLHFPLGLIFTSLIWIVGWEFV